MAELTHTHHAILRGLVLFAATGVALARPAALAVAAPQVPLEYAVKASFLYKFAPFVYWPSGALAADGAFNICLSGENAFGSVLDQEVSHEAVNGRPIAVRRISSARDVPACHILFVGKSAHAKEMLQAAAGNPILTVTDRDRGEAGGIIEFILRSGRVRFAIDANAARANRLEISSKLLDIALSVSGR